MSVTTTYTCDRCGKSQTTPDQMWWVCLNLRNGFREVGHGR